MAATDSTGSVVSDGTVPGALPGTIRRVILSHGLAALGMSVAWPLLLLLVWHETHSEVLLGLAGAARMLPYVMFSWATGRLADRFRRDRVVRWTLWARVALLTLMASCLAVDWTWAALGAATLAIAVATPAFPALAAAMPTAAGASSQRATDLLVTVEVASFVVGPALGGALLALPTRSLIPATAVLLVVVAAVLFVRVRLPHVADGCAESNPKILPLVRKSGELRGAIAVVCALNAGIAAMALVLLPFAEQAWDDTGTGIRHSHRSARLRRVGCTVAGSPRTFTTRAGPSRVAALRRLPAAGPARPVSGLCSGATGAGWGSRRARGSGRDLDHAGLHARRNAGQRVGVGGHGHDLDRDGRLTHHAGVGVRPRPEPRHRPGGGGHDGSLSLGEGTTVCRDVDACLSGGYSGRCVATSSNRLRAPSSHC